MSFPPELQLVVACCRWPPSPSRDAAVRGAAAAIDWDFFVRIVARHRVEGLVHDGLRRAGIAAPAAVTRGLAAAAASLAHRNLAFAAASMRLGAALDAAGIGFLFVKGVTLDTLAYGSLAVKRSWDIDLAVDPSAYDAACAVLETAGYRCQSPGSVLPAEREAWVRRHKHTIWTNAQGVAVELHFSLVDNPLLLPGLSVASPRRQVAIAPGLALPTLCGEELFAYLCVHGAAHAWSRLKWIADVAALLSHAEAAEIERLYDASQALGAGRCGGQALLLCARLFATPLPPALASKLRNDRITRALAAAALRSMVRGGADVELDAQMLGTVPIHVSHFFLQRGWRYKAAEVKRKLFVPGHPAAGAPRAVQPFLLIRGWAVRRARVGRGFYRPR